MQRLRLDGQETDMCIFRKTRCCIDGFTALQGLRSGSKFVDSQSLDIDGEFGRFEIWAGNIGALQAQNKPTSLDYRLRNSAGVTRQVEAILDDIVESLQECKYLSAHRVPTGYVIHKLMGKVADTFSGIAEKTVNGGSIKGHTESPESVSEDNDREELLSCVSDGISTLFKVSTIIRKATHRDRYARAAASDNSPIDPRYDIAHVRDKFPKIGIKESFWLAERLGKANTRRRQFLRYCRNHKERLAYPSAHDPENELADNPRKRQHHSSGSHEGSNVIDSESRCAPTSASTLKGLHAIDTTAEIEYIAADNLSQTSFTPTVTERSEEDLTVVPLEDVSGGNPEFECPYCCQIQRNVTERRWRNHVFADLRAYVCVNEDCSDVSFLSSRDWIEHEFDVHQRAWKCNRCSKTYTNRGKFVDHMASQHSNSLSENQLSELVEICWFQRPQIPADDCPFCDEWAVRLREINKHVPHDRPVLVSKKQYRRHVGAHMEQLALFAIDPSQDDGSEVESRSNNAVGEADHIHATSSHGNPLPEMGSLHQSEDRDYPGSQMGSPSGFTKHPDSNDSMNKPNFRFGCPYWKKIILDGSQERPKQSSCHKPPGFSTVARSKEHVYRVHQQPIHCDRCYRMFDTERELVHHLTAAIQCLVVPEKPTIQGYTDVQCAQLKSKVGFRGKTEEQKWNHMYRILFPNDTEFPSPYFVNSDVSSQDGVQLTGLTHSDREIPPQADATMELDSRAILFDSV